MRVSMLAKTIVLIILPLCALAQNQGGRGGREVPAARIVSFAAQPESVKAGDPVALTWATENPNNVTIGPDGVKVAARGIRQVFPTSTTTYTLTVTGPNNTVLTKSVTVNVTGSPAPAQQTKKAQSADARMPDGKPD